MVTKSRILANRFFIDDLSSDSSKLLKRMCCYLQGLHIKKQILHSLSVFDSSFLSGNFIMPF